MITPEQLPSSLSATQLNLPRHPDKAKREKPAMSGGRISSVLRLHRSSSPGLQRTPSGRITYRDVKSTLNISRAQATPRRPASQSSMLTRRSSSNDSTWKSMPSGMSFETPPSKSTREHGSVKNNQYAARQGAFSRESSTSNGSRHHRQVMLARESTLGGLVQGSMLQSATSSWIPSISTAKQHSRASRPTWPSLIDLLDLKARANSQCDNQDGGNQKLDETSQSDRTPSPQEELSTPLNPQTPKRPPIIVPCHTSVSCSLCQEYYDQDACACESGDSDCDVTDTGVKRRNRPMSCRIGLRDSIKRSLSGKTFNGSLSNFKSARTNSLGASTASLRDVEYKLNYVTISNGPIREPSGL